MWPRRPVSSPEVPAPGAVTGRPGGAGRKRVGWNCWANQVEDPGGSSQVIAQLGQPESGSDAGESCFPTGQRAVEAGTQGEAARKLLELLAENPRNLREAKISPAQSACTNEEEADSIKIKTLRFSEDERNQVHRQAGRSCVLCTRRAKGFSQECVMVSEQLGRF